MFCIVAECVCVSSRTKEKKYPSVGLLQTPRFVCRKWERRQRRRTLCVCVCRVRARVFGKLPSQPVECNDGSTALRVRGGGARGGSEMAGGGMDGRALRCGGGGTKKKRKRPRSHGSMSGAPRMCAYVCVCVCIPLRCCVGGACVKGEEDKGFLIYFFFTSLFSLSPPPPQSPHPYDTRRRGTPALSSLFLVAVHKRDAPAA